MDAVRRLQKKKHKKLRKSVKRLQKQLSEPPKSSKYGGLRRDPFLKKIPKDSSFVRKRKPVYWDPRNDYQSEVVDLTDPNAWGDFEQAYEAPTGARERNKMLKKLKYPKAGPSNVDYLEDPLIYAEDGTVGNGGMDEDVNGDCDQDMEYGNEDDYDYEDEEEESDIDLDEDVDDEEEDVDYDEEDDEEEEEDVDDELDEEQHDRSQMKKLPNGPLAPRYSDDSCSEDEQHLDEMKSGNGQTEQESNRLSVKETSQKTTSPSETYVEDNVVLTPAERVFSRNWEIFSLHNCILKALAGMKYTQPTEIQSECLTPAIRDRLDILGAAETGSGKTLAFGIPIVNRLILDGIRNKIGALILTPTRELAVQVRQHLLDITKYTSLHVISVVGGLCHEKQIRLINKRPEIIVATPGRLYDILQDDPSFQEALTDVRFLVIDEADRMIQEGHFEEMKQIIKFMNQNQKGKRQNFVFSATLTMDPHLPERVMQRNKNKKLSRMDQLKAILRMPKPKVIDLSKKIGTAETLTESRIFCEKPEQKDVLLYYFLYVHPGRTLVFCNSIDCVRRLKSVLETLCLRPLVLHADMQQRQRLRQLDRFANEKDSILIATDIAARGLDILNVQHVVHFNVPKAAETYIHRSGRTARVQQKGLSVLLVDGRELPQYRKLLHSLKREEDLPELPLKENVLKGCRLRVMSAREIEVMKHRQRKRSASNGWFMKYARDADVELEDDLLSRVPWAEDHKEKQRLRRLQELLKILLRKSLVPSNQRVGESLNMPQRDPLKLIRSSRGPLV